MKRIHNAKSRLFSSPNNRVIAATIGVFITSITLSAGMPVYLPLSQADNIGLPIIGFPIIWFCLFLFTLLVKKIWRAWALLFGLSAVHVAIIFLALNQ